MRLLISILLSVQVFSQTFEEKVHQYLKKEFPEYQKIEIKLQQYYSSDDEIRIDETRNINLGKGVAYIPVIATKGKKTSQSIVSVRVKLLKKVFVALNTMDKKTSIMINDFQTKILDVTNLNGNPVSINFEFSDYQLKSVIQKGEILLSEKIEKIPLVNAGDKVFAKVKKGRVTLTTEAFARQDGSSGDLIEIVSANNKIIKARIIGANKVIVE